MKTSYGTRPSLRLAAAIIAAFGFVLYFAFAAPLQTHAATGTNQQLNFQGRLLDNTGAVVADGSYNFEYKIYQDGTGCVAGGTSPCGGTLKWTETRTLTNRVTVKNGYFSVNLGSVTAFGASVDWNQDTLWLSVNIGGTANTASPTWDGEMTPFKRLTSTPYALNSALLGGLQAANFVQLAQGVQTDTSTANASIFINKNNASLTPNILQLQKSSSDVFVVGNGGSLAVTPSDTAATISLGSTAQTGTITLGQYSGASTSIINIGTNAGASSTQQVNIATSVLGISTLSLGSGSSTSTTTISGGTGGINLTPNGTSNTGVVIKPTNNSTAAFQLQSSSAADTLFTADTINNKLVVGNATGTNTATTQLIVDAATADPATGFNGAIYYNSSNNKFRCYQNSAWSDCLAASGNGIVSFTAGVQNVTASQTALAVPNMTLTSNAAVNFTAGVNTFAAPAAGSFRACQMIGNANTTAGTISVRWRVNGASVGSAACTISTAPNRTASTALDDGVVTFAQNDVIGVAVDTNAAFTPLTTDFVVYWSVEYNSINTAPSGATLQSAYNNLNTLTTNDAHDLSITAADTATDANLLFNLQCVTACSTNGRFAVQNGGTDVFTVNPNSGNIVIAPSGTGDLAFTGDNDSNIQIASTFSGTGPTINPVDITLTDNATAAGTAYGLSITNADNGANVGVPAALAYLKNANAAETVVDGLLVEQSGAGTLTNGLDVKQTAGAVTNGLTFTGTFSKLINSTNFNVTNAGVVTQSGSLTVNGTTLSLGNGSASTINTPSGGASLTIAPNGVGALNLATTNTGAVAIGNASGQFTLASSGGLNVSNVGGLTGVASIDTIATSATALTFAGAGTISSTGANALNLNSGVNGNVAIAPGGTGDLVATLDADTNAQFTASGINANINPVAISATYTGDQTSNVLDISLTDNISASTGVLYGLSITNADNAANTGVPDAIAYLKNANAADTVPDGLLVEQTGAGTLTNGLEIKQTAGAVTNGLVFTGTFGAVLKVGATTVINASGQIPTSQLTGNISFANISGATNTNALVIGTGGSLGTSGTGTITATDIGCTDCVALTAETTGNYVASTNTSVLTGLSGGSAGSEGAALTLGFDYTQALSGDVGLAANAAVFGQSGLVFEGSSADTNETYIAVTNPTSDHVFTFGDVASGNICISGISCAATSGTVGTFSGNYVASVANGTGITGGAAGSNAAALTLSVDQTASLTWTGTESFTPSGTGDVIISTDADSNFQVNYTSAVDATVDISHVNIVDNAAASTGTLYGLAVVNNDNGANVGVPDALAYLNNANAADTVPDGLLVEQTGAGTLTNGLEIKRTAGTVTNGLTFTGTFGAILKVGATTVINASGQVPTAQLTGNYVANAATSLLTGLNGGSAGSTGAALTLGFDYTQALSGDVGLAANAAVFGQSGLVFEGSAADTNETYIVVTNPTADRTFTFGDVASGNICISAVSCASTSGTAGTFTGNYVASVANGTGITGGAAGSNAAALTLGIDQTAALTWTGTQTFTPSGTNNVVVNGDNDSGLQVNSTFAGAGPTQNVISVTLTDNATAAGTAYGLSIINADNGANAGVPAALAYLKNANAAETVVDGLLVEQTGAGVLTNGLEIKQTAGTVTNGLTLTGTFTSALKVGANTILNGTGVLQSVGLSGTYSNALVLSATTNSYSGNSLNISATAVPGADIATISNTGQGVTTAGVNGLQINYVGGAAAIESSGVDVALTGGTTAAGIWNGLRVSQGTITAGTTVQDVKLETVALTTTSGATVINGLSLPTAGAINNATAGSITWTALNVSTPGVTQGAGGTAVANALKISLSTLTTGGTQNGLNFVNITAPTVGATSGLVFGSGNSTTWSDLHSTTAANNNIANVTITKSATGANANNFTIKNDAATKFNLFEVRDLTGNVNNFGGLALAGGFVSQQSYFGEEFNTFRSTSCSSNTFTTGQSFQARGDFGSPSNTACTTTTGTPTTTNLSGEISTSSVAATSNIANTCTYSSNAAATNANGSERIAASTTATNGHTADCLEYLGTGAAAPNMLFNTDNLPQVVMKVKTSAASQTQRVFVGVSNLSAAVASPVVGTKGLYFTNCSAPTTPTCAGTGWVGVVQDGTNSPTGATNTTVTCPTTGFAVNSKFSYLRIESRKGAAATSIEVQFFVDNDVSDGIQEVSCGTVLTTATAMGTSPLTMMMMSVAANNAAVANITNLDVDYFRVWQDDAPDFPQSPTTDFTPPAKTGVNEANLSTLPLTNELAAAAGPDPTSDLFDFNAATSEDAVFNHDVYVKGTLYADKIKANQIEGMEVITDKLSAIQTQLAKAKAAPAGSAPPTGLDTNGLIKLNGLQAVNLTVLAQIESKGGLIVDKDSQFNGKTIFALLAQFNGPVKFNGAVSFNSDAGGTALIKKDASKVVIKFSKEYASAPIISANYLFNGTDTSADQDKQQRLLDGGYSFIISQTTTKGFTIVLNKAATEDINFSWLAMLINNPQISQSQPITTASQ